MTIRTSIAWSRRWRWHSRGGETTPRRFLARIPLALLTTATPSTAGNASAALFQLTEKNRAMSDPRHPDEGYYVAAGKARSRGIELKATGNMTSNWTLFAGYTYADAYYMDSSPNPDGISFSQTTPKYLFKLWTNYRLPGDLNKFSIGGGTFVSSGISASDGVGTVRQGGYAPVIPRTRSAAACDVVATGPRRPPSSSRPGSRRWPARRCRPSAPR
ncbi:hypothetical protein CAL29_24810 [Bordetella genomosp. 10]|uniref:TonB-dependent receptor-like beta-barrel domain-containing protein n=1 Tax=Bordetella genomosp. 10 TaxID=1416804 RepID=A0A261S1E8_9BORD|nr:hypothetical protein CAL29_24810 [Bordetella genomosp. 10]